MIAFATGYARAVLGEGWLFQQCKRFHESSMWHRNQFQLVPPVYLFVCPFCLSGYHSLSICRSVDLYTDLSIYLSIHLSVYLSIYRSIYCICLSIYLPTYIHKYTYGWFSWQLQLLIMHFSRQFSIKRRCRMYPDTCEDQWSQSILNSWRLRLLCKPVTKLTENQSY